SACDSPSNSKIVCVRVSGRRPFIHHQRAISAVRPWCCAPGAITLSRTAFEKVELLLAGMKLSGGATATRQELYGPPHGPGQGFRLSGGTCKATTGQGRFTTSIV